MAVKTIEAPPDLQAVFARLHKAITTGLTEVMLSEEAEICRETPLAALANVIVNIINHAPPDQREGYLQYVTEELRAHVRGGGH